MSDAAARLRALDPLTSFIVRAPAGSGKTELLIQRYLRLLSTVDAPESILAITFTKKAAAEMRTRVLEALSSAQGPCPEAAHKALTWELARAAGTQLLENPARIRIQTIDSLCVTITRQMPWLARFGSVPEITEKAGPLYQEAARMTLLGPDNPDAVACLLLHLDNNFVRAQNLLAQMLEKRDQWLRHVTQPGVRSAIESCLEGIVAAGLQELYDAALDAGLAPAPDAGGWLQLAEELLTTKDEWRKKSRLAQSLCSNDTLLDCFKRLRNLPPPRFTDTQWQAMEAIVELLPIAAANLNIVFREHATVDFIELNLASLRALASPEGPTDLGLALGYRIQHILLDEFQDTSYTQFELLQRLTQTWDTGDGRTLFLVGDPMQSIYRFRLAEVGLFLKAWREGVGNVALEPLTLSVNFRSGVGIVEWVNRTFQDAFPEIEDPIHGAVRYSASSPSDQMRSANVHVHAFAGDSSRAAAAERAADLIVEALKHGTVGVLVRARSHLPAIVSELKARGIAYQAIEIDELGERGVIQDLMALTFALLHPADRISQLAVLRAPWSGLTLEQLASDPRAISSKVSEAAANRGRESLRDLVEQTWIHLGGPACITADSELADAQSYFDLLESLEEGGDIFDFETLREQVRGLFAQPDASADGRLQIMTIHKAKGLEFDTVILPGLDAQPKKDEGQLILWHEPSASQLLFAPISEAGSDETDGIYKYLSRVEQQKSDYEAVRLLYVAATRARTDLHLIGCAYVKSDGSIAAHSGSFLKILWPAVESHFAALRPALPPPDQKEVAWQPRPILRLPSNWKLPDPPPPVRWTHTEAAASEIPEISYEWVGDTLRHVGTAVHAYLARIAKDPSRQWTDTGIRAMLRNLGVATTELDAARSLVSRALKRIVNDARGRWVLAPHAEAESELAIGGVSDGQIFEVVIDRTFIDENGVRWVIDYKTSAHSGGSVEQFLANEKRRYQEQLERYARLLAQGETRPIKLGLYFPLVEPSWIEWEAPNVLPRQASLFASAERGT